MASVTTFTYDVKNVKQTNYAGVPSPPRSKTPVNGYSATSANVVFQVKVDSSGSDDIIVKMDTYTFVPNSTEKLADGNILLTDETKLKDYKWKFQAVQGVRNAYLIYQTQKGVNYLWTLEDSQDGTNIKLRPQLSTGDVQTQYWIFEVAKFA